MKRGSTLFLKIVVIVIGIPILALCIFLLPEIAKAAIEEVTKGAKWGYLLFGLLTIMYGSVVPFYFALYQTWKLLRYIDKDQAFSVLSVNALKNIKNCAIAISGLYGIGSVFFQFIARNVDLDPPFGLMGLMIIFASLVIAVFAAVLQRLLQDAIHIKSENDLTV